MPLHFPPPFLSVAAAENPIFATGTESWPVLRWVTAKCESDWKQCHGSALPGEFNRVFLSFLVINAVPACYFFLTGDHEQAAGSEHSTVASADRPVLKIFALLEWNIIVYGDVWIFLYCIYLVLDISSLVPGRDAFVSRIRRGDAIFLSVNIHGGGGVFLLSTKFITKSSAKISVDSKQKWKQITQGGVESTGRWGC